MSDLSPTRSLPEPETTVAVRCDWSHGVALEEHRGGSSLKPCGNCGVIVHHAPGSVQRVLTGRDALVMALGRAVDALNQFRRSRPVPSMMSGDYPDWRVRYDSLCHDEHIAGKSLSAFDASPETPDAE